MQILVVLSLLFSFAAPLHAAGPAAVFLLAGDSTTATQAANGGGWGDGFKNLTLTPPVFAVNYGHNGATTASFVAGGDWAVVLAQVVKYVPSSTVYVTIQFGHNDMKLANYAETFKANLRQMISDVQTRGGKPIIVTPLSRRNYNANGSIADTLQPWASYALSVASSSGSASIDLWQYSVHYLSQIGEPAARALDLNDGDHTHLNTHGSIVFGRMVADLLVREISAVGKVVKTDPVLSGQIWSGVPSY